MGNVFLAATAMPNTRTREDRARAASFILRRAAVGANYPFTRVRDLALSDEALLAITHFTLPAF
jgi:hypothetical protein